MKPRFNPRPTDRGWRLIISTLALSFLGTLLGDAILIILASAATLLIVFQLITLRIHWNKLAETTVDPQHSELKLVAGETLDKKITFNTKTGFQFNSPPEGYSLRPRMLESGSNEVTLYYKSTFFGEFKLTSLKSTICDNLELLVAQRDIPLFINISVYPKTTRAVVEAARFLAGEDIYSLGEEPTRLRGSGYEYADTRAYIRGDPFRRLDWRATARLGKLMVKDYFSEGGSGVQIIFDGRSPDPISHDELTEALIRIALSFAQRGNKLSLTTIGVNGVTDYTDLQPFDAVAVALKVAFIENRSAAEPAYELLDPQSSSRTRRLLASMNPVYTLSQVLDLTRSFPSLDVDVMKLVIYISSLQGDPLELLNLSSIIRVKGWGLDVVQPTRPWLHAQTLEESKKLSDHYSRLYKALDREQIRVEISARA